MESFMNRKKVNYLNNKDMLAEIHKSKNTYCEYIDPEYSMYDIIVEQDAIDTTPIPYDINIITDDMIQQGKKRRATRLTNSAIAEYLESTPCPDKKMIDKISPDDIDTSSLVIRVITYDHIDYYVGRKRNPKTVADTKVKLNFAPFKHYIIQDGALVEVGRSHWKDGHFSADHGNMTNKLANMFIMLVDRYAHKSNWRGYTYVDEMKGEALMQLSSMGLRFNEHKSDNPFSYYTASVSNAFTRVLNSEKTHQSLRDDLLEHQGQVPSFTRQIEHDDAINKIREAYDGNVE